MVPPSSTGSMSRSLTILAATRSRELSRASALHRSMWDVENVVPIEDRVFALAYRYRPPVTPLSQNGTVGTIGCRT